MSLLTPLLGLTTLVSIPLLASPAFQEPEAAQEPEVEVVSLGAAEIVPAKGHELMPWPRAYSGSMILTGVVEHGTWVEEGQPIARIDRRSLERQLRDAELALESAEYELESAHARADMQRESTEWSLQRKELALHRAMQELEAWEEFELGHAEAQKKLSAMYRKHGLDDALDELMQLEAMYTDDELTDATEEIVLKRQRRNLERSRFSAELQEAQAEHNAAMQWDRTSMAREMAVHEAQMDLEHTQRNAEMSMHKLERSMQAAERSLRDARERMEYLRQDSEQLELRAPQRGMLLHGSIADAGKKRHSMGGQLAPRQVAFTIYEPGSCEARKTLSATELRKVSNGQQVKLVMDGSGLELSGQLEIDAFPGPGGYAARIKIDGEHPQLVPGATASVSFRKGN